jgi:hypothetical protein
MSLPLLEGEIMDSPAPDPRDEELDSLSARVSQLESALATVEANAKRGAVVMVLNLLSASLKQVAAGKIDLKTVESSASNGDARWDAIKRGLAPRLAQAIDVLLTHGAKTNSQLAAAMKMDRTNCNNNVTLKLKQMGLIVKNGNEYSVKGL